MSGPFKILGNTFPNAASKVFERMLLTPARRPPADVFDDDLESVRATVSTAQGPLESWQFGRGPTVLLVHGWNGNAAQLRGFVRPLVRSGFRVFAYDAPAHGKASRRKTNLLEWRSAIESIAAEFGPVHGLIGHSFGSLAAMFAVSHGVPVRRLALISPPADLASLTRAIGQELGFPERVSRSMLERLGARLNVRWEDIKSDRLVSTVESPVLVVHDEGDREVPWHDGATVADAAVDGRFVRTRGLGHRRIVRDPAVIRRVVDFLSSTA